MRQYLLYSSSTHFALLACFLFLTRTPFSVKNPEPYYIDFIGGSQVVTMEKAALKQGAQKTPPSVREKPRSEDAEDFSSSGKALQKPSVLTGSDKLFEEAGKPGPEGETGSTLITDTNNFPYPWFITQVREALWNAWSAKMPSGGALKCTVKFDILRGGAAKSITVEKSSGNRLFDYAAQSSVESAAPFPPLPEDFYEERLSVHVEFKALR
ncbi:MAG: TonB family protein [Elusimicrobia bacterium]|nr:TonB family protein [Elusimicrobiota bacterium]